LQKFFIPLMPHISRRLATIFALVAFTITILLGFYLPHFVIIMTGLLVVIILSVFVEDRLSTIIAGIISAVAVMIHLFFSQRIGLPEDWTKYTFILVLIFLTTLIVLYIKSLISRMQFDQTHITSLFENATEGFVVTDSHGSIVLVNPSACRMFGYETEELIGQKIEILIPSHYRSGHVKLRDGFYEHPQNRRHQFPGGSQPQHLQTEQSALRDRIYRGYHASQGDRKKHSIATKAAGTGDG
jgi:PAS domain-containing protein